MKKLTSFIFCAFLLNFSTACAWGDFWGNPDIKTGTYELKGSNSKETFFPDYKGRVIITRQGDNYHLVWIIGDAQVQTGVGILEGDILSVAYNDLSNNTWGVMSFKVDSFMDELTGKWASHASTGYAYEQLSWRGYYNSY